MEHLSAGGRWNFEQSLICRLNQDGQDDLDNNFANGKKMINPQIILPGQTGWNGWTRGQKLPKGVYIYHLEVERVDGIKEVSSG